MIRMMFSSLILFTVLAFIGQAQVDLDDAERAYLQRDYTVAIALYEQAITDGMIDYRLHFNLGNAYYENGQLGYALLNYLRAQTLNPRDAEINTNIMRIRAARANFQRDERAWIDRIASSTHSFFTLNELAWLASALWCLWFGALTIAFLRRKTGWRGGLAISGAIVVLIASLLFVRLYADTYRPRAVITELSAEAMSGPSEVYVMLFPLYNAAEVRILERRGVWARFILPDGRQGWISRFTFEYID